MTSRYTVALIKPDGMRKHLTGLILYRAYMNDLDPVDMKYVQFDTFLTEAFYHEHLGKEFFPAHSEFMQSGRSLAILFQTIAPENDAVTRWRDLMGPTNPVDAKRTKTIRGEWGGRLPHNVVHGSDSEGRAVLEARLLGLEVPDA